jgi:glycosyltransferase involved in cell wall biosynthesis
MTSIYFAGPYKPIMCGIGDYTEFLTRKSPSGRWGVLSFNPKKYGGPLISNCEPQKGPVWYGIPDRQSYSSKVIQQGLDILGADRRDSIVWFQHEFGIWPQREQFVDMLKGLDIPTVVTFHTLHFQSIETRYGLRKEQYEFLSILLPYVDAITVFSRGVYGAVAAAFPEYIDKIHVIKHGIHHYPEVSRLTRREAREKLSDYLLYDTDLNSRTKEQLHRQRILLDTDEVVIGQTGFLSPAKGSELLYTVRDSLDKVVPNKRVVALRIGTPRDKYQEEYAVQLQKAQDSKPNFLLQVWLPQDMLPVAQRAFDINFYWPVECTQSGVLAHALGAGAVIASRDIEGVGETLKDAGAVVDADLTRLMLKMKNLIINPEFTEGISEGALDYAKEYSWENQVRQHYELAKHIIYTTPVPSESGTSRDYRHFPSFQAKVEQGTAGGQRYN